LEEHLRRTAHLWKCNWIFYSGSCAIGLHGEGGVYDLYCSQPPGGD